nr:hypothetical protein [Tanacetum cinerariifolium]
MLECSLLIHQESQGNIVDDLLVIDIIPKDDNEEGDSDLESIPEDEIDLVSGFEEAASDNDEDVKADSKVLKLRVNYSNQVTNKLKESVPQMIANTFKERMHELLADTLKNILPKIIEDTIQSSLLHFEVQGDSDCFCARTHHQADE